MDGDDDVGGGDGGVGDGDGVHLDDGDDGDDFPPPGGNFPVATQPAGELLSLCLLRLVVEAEMVSVQRPNSRSSGVRCTRRGTPSGGPGCPHRLLARRPRETRREVVWPPLAPP